MIGISRVEEFLLVEGHHLSITIKSYLSTQTRLGGCSQRQGNSLAYLIIVLVVVSSSGASGAYCSAVGRSPVNGTLLIANHRSRPKYLSISLPASVSCIFTSVVICFSTALCPFSWGFPLIKTQAELYEELARIFSEENNQSAQRELLMKEGTAKFAQTVGENDRQMQKVLQKQASHSNVRKTQPAVSWLFSKPFSLCLLWLSK